MASRPARKKSATRALPSDFLAHATREPCRIAR